jgi:hypothetical protein
VRAWIVAGELGAIDTARRRCGRPRYVVLPHHLAAFAAGRAAAKPPRTPRRRRLPAIPDYLADVPDSTGGAR